MAVADVYNYKFVSENIITAGQPSEDQLRSAQKEGFDAVINLATFDQERSIQNEQDLVGSLSMDYHHIPVEWEQPRYEDLNQFMDIMGNLEGKKVLVHCIANYRVTAFLSLYAMKYLGWGTERADSLIHAIWNPDEYPVWQAFINAMRRIFDEDI